MLDANVVAEILGSEIVAGIDDYVVVVDEFCRVGIEASRNGVDLSGGIHRPQSTAEHFDLRLADFSLGVSNLSL